MSLTCAPETPVPTEKRAGALPRRVGGGFFDPRMLLRSLPDALLKLDPRVQFRNPVMFVVEVGSVLTTYSAVRNPSVFAWTITAFLWLTVVFANLAEAVAEGRGKAQADTLRRTKRETVARRLIGWKPGQAEIREEEVAGSALTLGDMWWWRPARSSPATATWSRAWPRWTSRPSPASPRRSSASRAATGRRHRRHQGAVRPDRREDHLEAGRDVHRPNDRLGRGRVAAEDAERDRAEHPAGRAHHHLPARRGVAAADSVLLGRAAESGHPRRAARRADPHHDRRAAFRDRHRRHGPAPAAQRARDVGPPARCAWGRRNAC